MKIRNTTSDFPRKSAVQKARGHPVRHRTPSIHERLVDYTDRTDIIKSAHFRKDGSIRITDDQRMLSLEDAQSLKLRWKRVR